MPLPTDPAAPWPPADIAPYTDDQRKWAAWWSGDKSELRGTSGLQNTDPGRRSFWTRRASADGSQATALLHAALAGDVAATSADLIFGEPPELTVPDDGGRTDDDADTTTPTDAARAQDRLEELENDLGLANRLLEAAEAGAALGGTWLRVAWDDAVADHPLLTSVDADKAVPDFRMGQLSAVTFYEVVFEDSGEIWRHLERHEPGVILHGLYVGSSTELGRQVSLTDHPSLADIEPVIEVPAEIPGLLVRYVPNALPNRKRRRLPVGRSDFAGAEDELDALDEAWTSWMRDLRLGQARLIVPREFLDKPGRGAAGSFDPDRELFTTLDIAEPEKLTNPIKDVQFEIRVEQHERTCVNLVEQIVSNAGYSPQTFGLKIEGRAESGTALRLRENKTFRTVGRKRRYWGPSVERSAEDLLAVDRFVFGRRDTVVARPRIKWPDIINDPEGTARYLGLLRAADAASVETAVRLAQPNLDEDQVTAEVARINAERQVADPLGFEAP